MSFLNQNLIKNIGFKTVGKDIQISDKATFYNAKNISVGDRSRIDDYCFLSAGDGGIEIGKNVHLSIGVSIVGNGKVIIKDFAGLSSKTSVFSSNDDYSGDYMTNPTVDPDFTNVSSGTVFIGKHVVIGAGCVILPNVKINDGVSVGSLSLIKQDCKKFWIYAGIPAKPIRQRHKGMIEFEKRFLKHLL